METGQGAHLLQTQRATLQAASKRKGERPKDRKSLEHLINDFMKRYMANGRFLADDKHHFHASFLASTYQPCVASITRLNQIWIKDLQLETHHRGFFALLRAVTPAIVLTAVMIVMEDEIGDGITLSLHQQKDDRYRSANDVVQIGKACIIKEPYFNITGDGQYELRVDHVSDIIWLPSDDDRLPLVWRSQITELEEDAAALKDDGNGALKAGKIHEAIEIYTRALRHSKTDEQRQVIKLNRSLAHLKLGHYDQGLDDAGELTTTYQKSEKGFYRAARCLYELARFQECHDVLRVLLEQFPHCAEAKQEMARTETRLREQDRAGFDFKSMYDLAKKSPPQLDCATYIGPVAVKASGGSGRGLFTTKDVVAGELLLCEKAFAYCWTDGEDGRTGLITSLLLNRDTGRGLMGARADMITDIVQKIYHNVSLAPDFTSLHHGDYKAVTETVLDGVPIIDTFLVERIIAFNVFGCPRTTLESHFNRAEDQERKDGSYHTCGLFIKASYINHSCTSNARRSFIGDMQIVRAARNIPAGTEITFWYHVPDYTITYERMQKKLENWGFTCTCSICEHNKTMKKTVRDRRATLIQDQIAAFREHNGADLPKVERRLAAIEKTYTVPATQVPRLALWDPYLLLTRIYSSQHRHAEAIQSAWNVLKSLGFIIKRQDPSSSLTSAFEVEQWGLMHEFVPLAWVYLWIAFADQAPELCSKAEECARIAYKICVGEDETFDASYGKLAREAIDEGVDLWIALGKMRV